MVETLVLFQDPVFNRAAALARLREPRLCEDGSSSAIKVFFVLVLLEEAVVSLVALLPFVEKTRPSTSLAQEAIECDRQAILTARTKADWCVAATNIEVIPTKSAPVPLCDCSFLMPEHITCPTTYYLHSAG